MNAQSTFVAEHVPRWEQMLASLISTRSVFEAEHHIVALVERHITSLGATVQRVYHHPPRLTSLDGAQPPISSVTGRYSLVTRVRSSTRGRSLVLSTHLDTVAEGDPAAWDHPPFSAHVDEDTRTIYGRGAMDDKAGVAIALAVLETLLQAPVPLRGDVVFHFVLEDETTGNGTLLCIADGHVADAALIIDGTRMDRAVNEHAGTLQVAIRVKGRPASVSVSHMGINAADVLTDLLRHLREAVIGLNRGRIDPWTRFPSPYQFVVQALHSDSAHLTLPERAEAQVCVTFLPPFTVGGVISFLVQESERFARERSLPDLPLIERSGLAVEPVRSPTHQLGAVLQKCAADLCMPAIDIGPSTGTSDLRHFAGARIPCLLYGPGTGFNPHRANECYRMADLPTMIQLYLAVAAEWCGLDGDGPE